MECEIVEARLCADMTIVLFQLLSFPCVFIHITVLSDKIALVKKRQPVRDLSKAAAPDKYQLQHCLKLNTLLHVHVHLIMHTSRYTAAGLLSWRLYGSFALTV